MRKYFLPTILALFAMLSLTTLRSIVPELLYKQVISFSIACVVFAASWRLPFAFHQILAKWFYLALNIILLFLLLYGNLTRGISAWIVLPFGFRLQPSQFALPVVALYVSGFFSQEQKFTWPLLIKTLSAIALPAILILLEPDFGTALVFIAACMIFLWTNQLSWRQLLSLGLSALIVLFGLWFLVFQDYQRDRILHFLHLTQTNEMTALSSQQESSSSYNARQSLIAVGSGRLWGRGIGQGIQSHLRFLPERQTDFIFASFAEEWGFVGASFLLGLYFALLAFLLYMAHRLDDFKQKLYLLTIFAMLLVQIFINIGMNMALLPITGITLPFMSYGGSSVIALFYALGVGNAIIGAQRKKETRGFY